MADTGERVIRWGIIGVGNVCEVKSGPGFAKASGSALVAVMRRSLDKAQDFAARHGVANAYGDVDDLLADPDVDAVYVATRPGTHLEIARKVAAAGKPCYMEKPAARSAAETRELAALFGHGDCGGGDGDGDCGGGSGGGGGGGGAAVVALLPPVVVALPPAVVNKVPLFIAYYRRGMPRFWRAREIVAGGALGQLTDVQYRFTSGEMALLQAGADDRAAAAAAAAAAAGGGGATTTATSAAAAAPAVAPAEVPWRLEASEAGGGLLMDVGCHALDIIDFVVGAVDPASVVGRARNVATPCVAVEDTVQMCALLAPHGAGAGGAGGGGGAVVPLTASWNFAAAVKEPDFIVITGTRGVLRVTALDCGSALRLDMRDDDDDDGGGEGCRGGAPPPPPPRLDFAAPEHVQQPLIQMVVDELLGGGAAAGRPAAACPSTPASALRTAVVLDKLLAGYYGGRDDRFWEREDTWPKNAAPAGRLPE